MSDAVEDSVKHIARWLRQLAELKAKTKDWDGFETATAYAIDEIIKQAQRTK